MSTTGPTTPSKAPPIVIQALRLVGLGDDDLRGRLTTWIATLAGLLSGNLLLGTHAACQFVTYTATATNPGDGTGVATVTSLSTRFKTRPIAVVPVQCVDSKGASQRLPQFTWSWNDSGSLRVSTVTNVLVNPVTMTVLVVLG